MAEEKILNCFPSHLFGYRGRTFFITKDYKFAMLYKVDGNLVYQLYDDFKMLQQVIDLLVAMDIANPQYTFDKWKDINEVKNNIEIVRII
jgi:hypothetical protein